MTPNYDHPTAQPTRAFRRIPPAEQQAIREDAHRSAMRARRSVVTAKGRGGTVTFDGRFVEIRRSRFNAAGGGGTKRIPLRSIAAIQIKEPGWLTNGFVQFTIPGGNEVRAQFGRQAFDAAADENSVMFTRKQAPAFLALRDAIEDAMEALAQAPRY